MLKDYKLLKQEVKEWVDFSTKDEESWHLKNMHLDQFSIFKNVKRDDWFSSGIDLMEFILDLRIDLHQLNLCLHIVLDYSNEEIHQKKVDTTFFRKCMHLLTPPSLMFITEDYFEQEYANKLKLLSVSADIFKMNSYSRNLKFFYRTYFDESEDLFSRSIYIFKHQEIE